MDSEALRTFVAVHRLGGFQRAGESLGRSQPAISRRIALLEQDLGAPVFERIAGGVALSQAGLVLLPHAERVLAALRDGAEAVRDLRAADAGPVSLAAVGTLASTGLTGVLQRFSAAYPKVELSLRTATSSQVSELVRRGEVTLGLRYFDDPSPDLTAYALAPEALMVICGRAHRLAGQTVAKLHDLRDEHWLAFPRPDDRGEASAETIFAEFLVRKVAAIRWTAIDSLTAQKRLVEAGIGIALVPQSSIAEEIAQATLAVIAVSDLAAANPVNAVVRTHGYRSAAAEALLTILRDGRL